MVLYGARASRTENQDAIDASMVNMLADPKEARAGIKEVHFLPFNPVDKRTAITYIDDHGDWHRSSKGAPEEVTNHFLCLSFLLHLIWTKYKKTIVFYTYFFFIDLLLHYFIY